jgi:hypothetical protein
MTKNNLIEIIDSWENLNFMVREIGRHPELFSGLMEIALYGTEAKTWRAAYLADKIHDEYPELLLPFLDKIIQQLKLETNSGKKRHFLKLLSMNKIKEQHFGFLVDYCLTTLDSAKEPPAVRVHAMQVLYNISEKEPGLKAELLATIEHEMEYHSTAGIRSRGSKLAGKLRKQIQGEF